MTQKVEFVETMLDNLNIRPGPNETRDTLQHIFTAAELAANTALQIFDGPGDVDSPSACDSNGVTDIANQSEDSASNQKDDAQSSDDSAYMKELHRLRLMRQLV
jgi:hypothetical protein